MTTDDDGGGDDDGDDDGDDGDGDDDGDVIIVRSKYFASTASASPRERTDAKTVGGASRPANTSRPT